MQIQSSEGMEAPEQQIITSDRLLTKKDDSDSVYNALNSIKNQE